MNQDLNLESRVPTTDEFISKRNERRGWYAILDFWNALLQTKKEGKKKKEKKKELLSNNQSNPSK